MKKLFYFLLFLVLSVLAATFTIQNPQEVLVQYYLGFTWRGPLVILILTSLAIGIVVGSLVGFAKSLRLKRKYSRLVKASSTVKGHKDQSSVVTNTKA